MSDEIIRQSFQETQNTTIFSSDEVDQTQEWAGQMIKKLKFQTNKHYHIHDQQTIQKKWSHPHKPQVLCIILILIISSEQQSNTFKILLTIEIRKTSGKNKPQMAGHKFYNYQPKNKVNKLVQQKTVQDIITVKINSSIKDYSLIDVSKSVYTKDEIDQIYGILKVFNNLNVQNLNNQQFDFFLKNDLVNIEKRKSCPKSKIQQFLLYRELQQVIILSIKVAQLPCFSAVNKNNEPMKKTIQTEINQRDKNLIIFQQMKQQLIQMRLELKNWQDTKSYYTKIQNTKCFQLNKFEKIKNPYKKSRAELKARIKIFQKDKRQWQKTKLANDLTRITKSQQKSQIKQKIIGSLSYIIPMLLTVQISNTVFKARYQIQKIDISLNGQQAKKTSQTQKVEQTKLWLGVKSAFSKIKNPSNLKISNQKSLDLTSLDETNDSQTAQDQKQLKKIKVEIERNIFFIVNIQKQITNNLITQDDYTLQEINKINAKLELLNKQYNQINNILSSKKSFQNQYRFLLQFSQQKFTHFVQSFLDCTKVYEQNSKFYKRKIYVKWEQGDLYNLVYKPVQDKTAYLYAKQLIKMLQQMAFILKHLQDMKMLHRDIKLANYVLDKSGKLILIDFGSCYPNIDNTIEHQYDQTIRTTYGLSYYRLQQKSQNALSSQQRNQCHDIYTKYNPQSYNRHISFDVYCIGLIIQLFLKQMVSSQSQSYAFLKQSLQFVKHECLMKDPQYRLTPTQLYQFISKIKIAYDLKCTFPGQSIQNQIRKTISSFRK